MTPAPRRVAVIGSGVAGLTAAYVASRSAHVTLFEADARLGGHADTHLVPVPDGRGGEVVVPIDTGFIVHNERTYPVLLRMFAELGVATQDSEMSMSIRDDAAPGGGLEWAGALGLPGLFPTWRHALRPGYLRMLTEIPRFHRMARRLLDTEGSDLGARETFGDLLDRGGFSADFRAHFAEPLVGAVWSTDPAQALEYPARYLFRFLDHHGMLGVFGSPQWRTVTGGSREYVERVAALLPDVRVGTKVTSVVETPDEVRVTDGNGEQSSYDAVVIATHPHQALAMLAQPTPAQQQVLSALTYTPNTAQLHTDTSVLPRNERARASWNYLRRDAARLDDLPTLEERGGPVTITYDLTRLMRVPELPGAPGTRFLVTLGGLDLVDPSTVIDTMEYEHPLYTRESVAAQARLGECDTARIALAGAYHGWGFHEDGARSGVEAAGRLGMTWEGTAPTATPGTDPAGTVFRTTIRHTRRAPWRRTFEHSSRTWVVDLDDLPDHGALAGVKGSFEARDHLGDPERSIRCNVEAFLDLHGIELDRAGRRGRVLMAAQPRAFGYCFNPISVFWCFAGDQALTDVPAAVVVEVHNTYGDRHAYLVHPDEQGRAETPKAMYVSPFHGTDGTYTLAVPTPSAGADGRLHVAVALRTDDGATFSASLSGRPDHGRSSTWRAAGAALRGSVLIRLHGVWLWARRLRIHPRPDHHQEGVR
ncbi:DUF1365 family protein [Nocardioides sp. ChNu-153]|uniref:FAD-dependent oxidoreductase n=1 Tax=unclassified Nocardioides TaxID=2615069 RepID=UPI0024056EAD|nr:MULTISPECIES: FAD-dependent oxidoreductase [unclassified Nocardioides]MDF9715145.1 DUF1365 family protein [Nocardioides sp. ChNu-99]MDN7121077.1 DUF1365 family protein [Nocardioides sp. ChNu-153]